MRVYHIRWIEALAVAACAAALLAASRAGAAGDGAAGFGAEPASDAAAPLWPLAERTCVTGSFCEYRSGHFHAGIDVSTGGAIGLAVQAVADGRVVRLRASPYGYGRVIYYDVAGPSRTRQIVCAHLSDFAPRWRALVDAEQERLGKYTVDFAVPDSPRVAAGEVIAYTGDTGAGPPHLHFEVRDGDADPINPLTHGWKAPDTTPPVIRKIRFVPLGLDGRVDGGLDPVVVAVVRGADGVLRAVRTVALRSPVGVEVSAADRVTGCDAARGIFAASLELDGAELFATEFSGVSYFSDWGDVEVRYDYGARLDGEGEFVRLFDPVGYEGAFPAGLDGEHALTIRISDEAGNAAECALACRTGQADDSTRVAAAGAGATSWRLVPEGLIIRVSSGQDDAPKKEMSGLEESPFLIRAIIPSTPRGTLRDRKPADPFDVEPAAANAVATWYAIPTERLSPKPPAFGGWPFLDRDVHSGVRVECFEPGSVPDVDRPSLELSGFLAPIGPGPCAAWGEQTTITFSRDGLYGQALITATGEPMEPVIPTGLILRSELARFDPRDALLRKPAELEFAIPDSLAPCARRLAVYSVDRRGAVDCLGGAFDEFRRGIITTTRHLGTFVLLEDASPPRLSSPRPANGAVVTRGLRKLSVRVSDVGEGLDDEGVRFTIDGARLIPEYDPEAGIIIARPKTSLASGPHRMEVVLSDKAGNASSIASRFTVGSGSGGAKSGGTSGGAKKSAAKVSKPKGKRP